MQRLPHLASAVFLAITGQRNLGVVQVVINQVTANHQPLGTRLIGQFKSVLPDEFSQPTSRPLGPMGVELGIGGLKVKPAAGVIGDIGGNGLGPLHDRRPIAQGAQY